jgi:hypothetical protein
MTRARGPFVVAMSVAATASLRMGMRGAREAAHLRGWSVDGIQCGRGALRREKDG